jgi:archaellum component FlaC
LLRVSTPPIGNAINAQYNWEIRGLDIDRSKIELLASQYQQVARDFSQLMENLSQEAWQ